jgi:mannosylglycoprotein endo-beta-mannosidase
MKHLKLTLILLCWFTLANAQNKYELTGGWKGIPSSQIKVTGLELSKFSYPIDKWKPAVVPGTVLTTMLVNKEVPDPFFGMNNEKIADIYKTGRAYYTYWFAKDFKEAAPVNGQQVWLNFRGINYSCDIFLNGQKVNKSLYKGMFLRKSFNITGMLSKTGNNRLAVIVHPPDVVGNPNGGQGGDGTIARGVAHQYTAGWDWIRPIRDRNTGIWDKVFIERTGVVNIKDPHVVTLVPGKRNTEGIQQSATLKVSVEVENTAGRKVDGLLTYTLEGQKVSKPVSIAAGQTAEIQLPDFLLKNPKLWWPAGYGKQNLYKLNIQFLENGKQVSDEEALTFGVREIQTSWNETTGSKQVYVNGQKIFIKGGNWIISDAMLRFSQERYNAEIRFHKDMNLNLLRVWGGALVERPEFYDACDREGLLVMQDFWVSGDSNGRWTDPMKADDQWTRRQYPDDHNLFLESASDMIKMVRNHASLAIWCGGNEITPPEDIIVPLRDVILPKLDGTRWFVDYSNSDEMSKNTLGGNGDGPYGIQAVNTFWEHKTYPFNSEVGSVGVGDEESLKRFLLPENLVAPEYTGLDKNGNPSEKVDSVWDYHNYKGVGYNGFLEPYEKPKNLKDFAMKAQLVNFDQYRALMEGFSAHMWSWYTGVIIWKTQNPWTSMRGQMYDYYLDPNACLYGLRSGSEALHAMYNPINGMVMIVNNGFKQERDLMLVVTSYDMKGKAKELTKVFCYLEPSDVKNILSLKKAVDELSADEGSFLSLQIQDVNKNVLSDNLYWMADKKGMYSGLNKMESAGLQATAKSISKNKIEVTLSNAGQNPVAFFNRISLIDGATKKRVLPVFYDENYVSITPGAQKKVIVEYDPALLKGKGLINISGWNVKELNVEVN